VIIIITVPVIIPNRQLVPVTILPAELLRPELASLNVKRGIIVLAVLKRLALAVPIMPMWAALALRPAPVVRLAPIVKLVIVLAWPVQLAIIIPAVPVSLAVIIIITVLAIICKIRFLPATILLAELLRLEAASLFVKLEIGALAASNQLVRLVFTALLLV
jgi:hypothetical protein